MASRNVKTRLNPGGTKPELDNQDYKSVVLSQFEALKNIKELLLLTYSQPTEDAFATFEYLFHDDEFNEELMRTSNPHLNDAVVLAMGDFSNFPAVIELVDKYLDIVAKQVDQLNAPPSDVISELISRPVPKSKKSQH